MKLPSTSPRSSEQGASMLVFLFVMLTVVVIAASLAAVVASASKVTRARGQMISAIQFAQGGAVIACNDLNNAITSSSGGTLANNLASTTNGGYTAISSTVYERTISSPFTNQSVTARIELSSAASPKSAKVITTATVGGSTQTATVHTKIGWGFPAAIVSVNAGTTSTSNAKSVGQAGNVAVNGGSGIIIINGNGGLAVMANGRVNIDTNYLNSPASAYSMSNWATANQIPDYTSQGTLNSLFDLDRLIAVADLTPGGYAKDGHNHFTNISDFMVAQNNYSNKYNKAMEGVIVVDVVETDPNLTKLTDDPWNSKTTAVPTTTNKVATTFDKKGNVVTVGSTNVVTGYTNIVATGGLPYGINIKGTLLMNFTGTGWDPVTEKIIVKAEMNVNAGNLSGLVATNPATYSSGFLTNNCSNSGRNPTNIDITSKGFDNFQVGDDLPAVIYSTGCLDTHGAVDVCGAFYTPCYIELENKSDYQTQYISGIVICGHGIYYENTQTHSTSIITFDSSAVDSLTTFGGAGKSVTQTYWEP